MQVHDREDNELLRAEMVGEGVTEQPKEQDMVLTQGIVARKEILQLCWVGLMFLIQKAGMVERLL